MLRPQPSDVVSTGSGPASAGRAVGGVPVHPLNACMAMVLFLLRVPDHAGPERAHFGPYAPARRAGRTPSVADVSCPAPFARS
jgi:hypothetical protein